MCSPPWQTRADGSSELSPTIYGWVYDHLGLVDRRDDICLKDKPTPSVRQQILLVVCHSIGVEYLQVLLAYGFSPMMLCLI